MRDGRDGARDFRRRPQKVFDEGINRHFHLAPRPSRLVKARAFARLALFADGLADALEFLRHLLVGGDNFIEGIGDLSWQARPGARKPRGKVAIAHGLQAG